jgi:divalent metal cation (Fe/Co/Zn/Cd) transporter
VPSAAALARAASRAGLVRQAFRLEYLTLAWMTVEAAVGIGAGIAAGSLALTAFGADSLIELASAGVLVWRLNVELRQGEEFAESAERLAARIGGALLAALAAYVVIAAGWKLWTRAGAEFSAAGFVLSLAAIPIMAWLARRKLQLAEALGSRALRADAVESIACGWLAFVVVAALAAQFALARFAFPAWWVDPAASLAIVYFLVREAREAWSGEDCCDDD